MYTSRISPRLENHYMRKRFKLLVCLLMGGSMCGCQLLSDSTRSLSNVQRELDQALQPKAKLASSATSPSNIVANPPAKTIRFDGREVVLGTAEGTGMTTEELYTQLSNLLRQGKGFSAANLVGRNAPVAEQLLWELAGNPAEKEQVKLIAGVLSAGIDPAVAWNGMLAQAQIAPKPASAYYQLRKSFADKLRVEEPTEVECEQLRVAAQAVQHPLAMLDYLQLFAVRELIAGRHGWAESLFRQATEIAEQNRDSARAAEAWLMLAVTAQAADQPAKLEQAWLKAIEHELALHATPDRRLDTAFWTRVDALRPENVAWPQKISPALKPHARFADCELRNDSPPELVLRCVIGSAQYEAGKPQLALIHFKKAEHLASEDAVLWLRIAQGKCFAALGQTQAAAALLSGPAASKQPELAAAAMAAIGSAKLHAGAYQQGAQLLHKALNDSPTLVWSTRSSAEADLALASLILGDTDAGLQKLKSAQKKFESEGNVQSLLHSLENELEILRHENRAEQAKLLERKIAAIENA